MNPLGDETLDALPDWWAKGPCVCVGEDKDEADSPEDETR